MLSQQQPSEKETRPSFFSRFLSRVDGCQLSLEFDGKADTDRVAIDDIPNQARERLHLFGWREAVKGRVMLTPSSSYSHKGILIELLGVISIFTDGENKVVFLQQQRRFEADTVTKATAFDFEFASLKEHESYRGLNATVSYTVRVIVARIVKNASLREEVWVTRVHDQLAAQHPTANGGARQANYFREETFGPRSVAMEVGVENLVHIEFRYHKKEFTLDEQVLGKVTFKVADMDILYGEVGLVRKEYLGDTTSTDYESETLQKFEFMDGTPIVGEVVPIRLYLNSIPRLTPTYLNVHDKFRVQYFLNLVLVSGENKRYFKQQEIVLYRGAGQERPVNMDPLNGR